MSLNRIQATWELLKRDERGGLIGNLAVRAHDLIANAIPAAVSPLLNRHNTYEVAPRTSDFSGTINGVRNALHARVFSKGNPLNGFAKAAELAIGGLDGVVSDVMHFAGAKKGYVIHAVD
jgi:hypothetical protein